MTEQAAITDAIVECDIKYTLPIEFDQKDLKFGKDVIVESIKNGRLSSERTQINLSKTIDIGRKQGEGTLESKISIDIPQIEVVIKIGDSKTQEFSLKIIGDYTLGVKLKALLGLNYKKDIDLLELPVGKVFFQVGPLPVYMKASLQVILLPELKIGGNLEYGTSYIYKLDYGAFYKNSLWRNANNSREEFNEPSLSKIGAEFSSKVELDLKPVLQPYGIVGFEIGFGARPGLKATPEFTQEHLNIFVDFIMSLFVSIGIDINVKFLGLRFEGENELNLVLPSTPVKVFKIPNNQIQKSSQLDVSTRPGPKVLAHSASIQYDIKFSTPSLTVKEYGICWSMSDVSPTINSPNSINRYQDNFPYSSEPLQINSSGGDRLGIFGFMNELVPNTKYYVRSYAKISNEIIYGNVVEFTTCSLSFPSGKFNGFSELTANRFVGKVSVESGCEVSVNYTVYKIKDGVSKLYIRSGTYCNVNGIKPALSLDPTPYSTDINSPGLSAIDPVTNQPFPMFIKGENYAIKVIFCNEKGSSETKLFYFEL